MTDEQDFDDRYELRRGAPALTPDGGVDATTLGWVDAVALGFLNGAPDATKLVADTRARIEDGLRSIDVYRKQPVPGSLDESSPVGTFGVFPKDLSWGDGTSVRTMAIAAVTVRATDRRRGILRRMMTTALDDAVANGFPLAALTASEGTIYRRFGFGPAIRERSVTVRRRGALPFLVETTGEVVVVPTSTLHDGVARQVFDRFHARTLGSMVRNTAAWGYLLGHPLNQSEPDRAVRAAIHRDGEDVDGYVTFRFHEQKGTPTRIEIVDLIAADERASVALWEFLLSIDLVDEVQYPFARIDDPIVHVLADGRAYDIDHEEDHVWLRVLDVAAVLEGRPYAADGFVTLAVSDALGHAEGTYELTVLEGRGRVARTAAGPTPVGSPGVLALDVATLGSMLLGAVDPVVLHDVGLIAGDADAAAALRAMLRPARTPHGMTYF